LTGSDVISAFFSLGAASSNGFIIMPLANKPNSQLSLHSLHLSTLARFVKLSPFFNLSNIRRASFCFLTSENI
jgi:hypothetical protein